MALLLLLQQSPTLLVGLCLVIGLMVGSFLNVVIYRLPVMLHRDWRQECLSFLSQSAEEHQESALLAALTTARQRDASNNAPFNLMLPHSRCPNCQSPIKPYQNIPVLSYFLLLRCKCAVCKNPIALRYPLIEALTGFCSAVVAWDMGYGAALPWALLLTWGLIALSLIDFDHQLLPDNITLPLLWLGLLLSEFGLFTGTDSSIIGAIAGYMSLWSVYQLFKLLTGKEGMGFGDFKLLAMLGAWLGWQFLPLIILMSSLVGAIIGIGLIILTRKDRSIPIPFGPYLAIAGWIALLWGNELNGLYLASVGL